MTRFERWFLRRLLRREVRQGYDHDRRVPGLYGLIREACEKEFFEDNSPTLSAFLAECFEQSQPKTAAIHDETGGGRLIIGPAINLPSPRALTDDDCFTECLRIQILDHQKLTDVQIGKIAGAYARTHGFDEPLFSPACDWSKARSDGIITIRRRRPAEETEALRQQRQRESDEAILALVRVEELPAETITTGDQA